jgi:hypothetical protein
MASIIAKVFENKSNGQLSIVLAKRKLKKIAELNMPDKPSRIKFNLEGIW